MSTNPLERSRLGVIFSSYYLVYAKGETVLDVGCGEGVLSDLLPVRYAQYYEGLGKRFF